MVHRQQVRGNVAAAGTATVPLPWNTLGFTGDVPVRVVVDPYNRLAEIQRDQQRGHGHPDHQDPARPQHWTSITLSDDEPVAGEAVTVTLPLRNNGQTTPPAQTVALYDGNPDAGGTLVGRACGRPRRRRDDRRHLHLDAGRARPAPPLRPRRSRTAR